MQPQIALGQYLATRSAIPRVVGVLATVFAVVGLCATGLWTWGSLEDLGHHHRHDWDSVKTWLWVWGGLSVVVSALHLTGGLSALLYRRRAPRFMTAYAVAALVLVVADVAILIALWPASSRHLADSVQIPHFVFDGLAWMWPTVVLVLMNTRRAKQACVENPLT
ncbi:MAG TPA: hypothetical protein VMJ10_08725 [Kofleriaceae bacterium]|nr:hypothetical protein [Kofleriaceae bacterium]